MTSVKRTVRKDGSIRVRYVARPRGLGGIPIFLGEKVTREEALETERLFREKRMERLEADRRGRRRVRR